MSDFTVPIRRSRRVTTLPDPPRESPLVMVNKIIQERYVESIKRRLHERSFYLNLFTPDPWDEAVRSIEQIHETRQEWPWPDRVDASG